MFPKSEVHPIVFEELYIKEQKEKFEENIQDLESEN